MPVEKKTKEVYYSPRRRRHFMTKLAAARAEASARIKRFFPTEMPETQYSDYGSPISHDPGWHYTEEPRLIAIYDRLVARYMRQLS